MTRKIAAIVAIQNYMTLTPEVFFARADGEAIAQCATDLGFEIRWQWFDDEATWRRLDHFVNTAANELESGDEFLFYYAGHGFWKNTNLITAYDTVSKVKDTVQLRPLIDGLQKKKIKSMLFLDACHSGLNLVSGESPFSIDELEYLNGRSELFAFFAACKSDESSYPDEDRSHGIWTYYLKEALSGLAFDAMSPKPFVTAYSLQVFLYRKATERAAELGKKQTPILALKLTDQFFVANLASKLPEFKPMSIGESSIKWLSFIKAGDMKVKNLYGFRSGFHSPPSREAKSWVATLATRNVNEDFEVEFSKIKAEMNFMARDMQKKAVNSSFALRQLNTPLFTFSTFVRQSEADFSKAEKQRGYFLSPDQSHVLSMSAFTKLLGKSFPTLRWSLEEPLEPKKLIDVFEEAGFEVNYDSEFSYAEIQLDNGTWVHFSYDKVTVDTSTSMLPLDLLKAACEALKLICVTGKFEVNIPGYLMELL